MAEELASRGWHVVAVARTVGALEELDDRIKANRQPGGGAVTLARHARVHEALDLGDMLVKNGLYASHAGISTFRVGR
jgi:NADP-dependent 3-hydroxy acid dehydrogenase YdfG